MDVVKSERGKWIIVHDGREIDQDFETEKAAWSWADRNIDDQVFDSPNTFTPGPIRYRTPPPSGRVQ